ncbi:MAG: peptidase M14 [Acidobacteria bacterium]|nr:peptidase M14 [Acidobacteriota bacterium]
MRSLSGLLFCSLALAAVPTPREHLGYTPGDDYKLADYADVTAYFRKLAASSDRIRLEQFGSSANGKPLLVAYLSSPENLKQLDRWKSISRRLALGQANLEEAHKLAAEGRAIVWIDSGLHASEVAPVQHSFDLAYRMITAEDEETRRIRDRVILLQVPVINPDGLDWIAHWYRSNVGSPHELAPLPRLYHKYAGHDNNRDWFMLNLPESRHVSSMLFNEWFPQIVYNQHQSPAFPARIFVPPYAEPLNPHIPAVVMEGINTIGAAMKERFARENKPGILSYFGFDAWWNGGLRSVPAFHNMHGILTETALHSYATPKVYDAKDFPARFGNGVPTREPSVFYQRPWMGGKWGVRDAIEYMLTADFAILDQAAVRSGYYLLKAWELARKSMDTPKPHAWILPAGQWDFSEAANMTNRLRMSGVQVYRSRSAFTAAGREYGAGSIVLPGGQPFRPYLIDLMEPQKYPEIRAGQSGAAKRPYDVAGWTLPMNMGVEVVRAEDPFDAALDPVQTGIAPPETLERKQNASFRSLATLLARAAPARFTSGGDIVTEGAAYTSAAWEIRQPRTALYEPYTANMDTGWTQYVLEDYKIPHTLIHNEDFQRNNLATRFDSIILASQSAQGILHGTRPGEPGGRGPDPDATTVQRPEFSGGIGLKGAAHLDEFVRQGGTLIAFDDATQLPVQQFGLPLRTVSKENFYCPGSIIRIKIESGHPLAWGMKPDSYAFLNDGGYAWETSLTKEYNKGDREVRAVARYASSNLLASGWMSGERAVLGKQILVEARHGKGRVVLFGFRPQFRAQTTGTFKFLLNAIYLASAKQL